MKLVCTIFSLLVCLTVSSALLCETETDCREGECCVAILGIQVYNRGICLKLNKEGRRCREPESKLEYFGGKYMGYCPCQEGLSCEPRPPRGNRDPPRFRLTFTCQGTSSTPSPGTTSTSSPETTSTSSPGITSTSSPGTTSTNGPETTAPPTGTSTTEIPTTDGETTTNGGETTTNGEETTTNGEETTTNGGETTTRNTILKLIPRTISYSHQLTESDTVENEKELHKDGSGL